MSGFKGLGVSKKDTAQGGVYSLTADDIVDGELHITEDLLNKTVIAKTSVTDYYISIFLKPIGKDGDTFTVKNVDDVTDGDYAYLEFYDDDYSGNIFVPQLWGHVLEYHNKEIMFLKEGDKWRRLDNTGLFKIDEDEVPQFDNSSLYFNRRNINFKGELMFIESDMAENGYFSNKSNVMRLYPTLVEFYQNILPAVGYDVNLGDAVKRFQTLFAVNGDFSGVVKAADPVDATDLINKQYFEANLPAAGMAELADDLTPVLGGELDCNEKGLKNVGWSQIPYLGVRELLLGQHSDEVADYCSLSWKTDEGDYFNFGTGIDGTERKLYMGGPNPTFNPHTWICFTRQVEYDIDVAALDALRDSAIVNKAWVLSKIPAAVDLSAISESLIPDTDDTYDLGNVGSNFNQLWCNRIGKSTRYIDTSSNYFDYRADGHYLRALGNLVIAINSSAATFYQKIQSSGAGTLDIGSTTNRFKTLFAVNGDFSGVVKAADPVDATDVVNKQYFEANLPAAGISALFDDASPKLAANLDANGKMFLNVGSIGANYISAKLGEVSFVDSSQEGYSHKINASNGALRILIRDNSEGLAVLDIKQTKLTPIENEVYDLGELLNRFNTLYAKDIDLSGILKAGNYIDANSQNVINVKDLIFDGINLPNIKTNSDTITYAVDADNDGGVAGHKFYSKGVKVLEVANNGIKQSAWVYPTADNSYDLGAPTNRYKTMYAHDVDVANGATGSFTSQDGKTVTVTKGIITGIV